MRLTRFSRFWVMACYLAAQLRIAFASSIGLGVPSAP